MKPKELIETMERYLEKFPEMEDLDITLTTTNKRRVKGSFYNHFKMTSWGFNPLTGSRGFNIGIEKS
jgi:hypothetical protein